MSSSPARSASDPAAVAAALSDDGLLRVFVRPTGDAVAAAGLLARAAEARGTGFQVRPTRAETAPSGDGTAVAVGWPAAETAALSPDGRPVSVAAAEAVREAGGEPDPTLALAGAVAAGVHPDAAGTTASQQSDGTGALVEAAGRRDAVTRRPGVATPTADLVDGLAHSTLLWLPTSGDEAATRELLADLGATEPGTGVDTETNRRLASVVALDATEGAPETAVAAVERTLRPVVTDGPFETVGGFADVLRATARTDPGLAVALAVSPESVRGAALDAWRAHGRTVHALAAGAETARYDGVSVFRVDGADATADPPAAAALPTLCRLAAAYRAREATTLVVTDGAASVASTAHDATELLAPVAADPVGHPGLATATDTDAPQTVVETVRGAV
ncbi:exonuclease RecJ [Halobaculum sp. MBLA0143]|uniref:exonuclease RecJ n=1 Tax=Halobaculum sp. MBLA0143 TaxID=3079933 RepID=UPI003523E650